MTRLTVAVFALALVLNVAYYGWNALAPIVDDFLNPPIETRSPPVNVCLYNPSSCPVNH